MVKIYLSNCCFVAFEEGKLIGGLVSSVELLPNVIVEPSKHTTGCASKRADWLTCSTIMW